ncbi:MAG: Rv3654c family TadE-like protein, partial [Mycobacterium sp.]
ADLAALAGAAGLPAGAHIACGQATALARAMGTVAVRCTVDGLDVVVTVEASRSLGPAGMEPARAIARAGPAGMAGSRDN